MAQSFVPFRVQRQALSAGVATAITSPFYHKAVRILNAGPDDIEVGHDLVNDSGNFFVIGAGFERTIELANFNSATPRFDPTATAFYLLALNQNSTAVLIWT